MGGLVKQIEQAPDREACNLGLSDRRLQFLPIENAPQVEDRSCWRGRRNTLTPGRFFRGQARRAVDPDPLALRPACSAGIVTSTTPFLGRRIPQFIAALRWLSTAPSPHASTAAIHQPW